MSRGRAARQWLLYATFAGFTAVGIALLLTGGRSDRILGLIVVLMFGAGGVAYVASTRRRREAALVVTEVLTDGRTERALVVPVRKVKWLVMLIGALGMGAAMLLMGIYAPLFSRSDRPVVVQAVGYGGGALFLLLGLAQLATLRRGPPRLAMLSSGADMTGIGSCFVPWDAVLDIGVHEMATRGAVQRFAAVRVSDPELIRRRPAARILTAGNRAVSGWDVTYAEAMFDVTADELAWLLHAFVEQPELRQAAVSLPDGAVSYATFAELHMGEGHVPGSRPHDPFAPPAGGDGRTSAPQG